MWVTLLCLWPLVTASSDYSTSNNLVGQPEFPLQAVPQNQEDNKIPLFPSEIDSRGFHESVFDGIGDYYPTWPGVYFKRYARSSDKVGEGVRKKRDLSKEEETEEAKLEDKKSGRRYVRGMEMGSSGFHGDTFNSGFGDFATMRRRRVAAWKRRADNDLKTNPGLLQDQLSQTEVMRKRQATAKRLFLKIREAMKRRPEMDSMGFHGDTFGNGFGEFDTMKKRRPEMDSMGFHGDTFGNGFGEFDIMKKRRPEMDSMGFHGDTFGNGFGEFDIMKKRRPEMDSMGFHGDTFGNGFGEFDTMKKRRPEMDSMGFHGDTFGGGFGEFETMKKRRPEMDSMGFHGDTFGGGFGEFETMKKRRPEMDSMGFHGDVFSRGFGDFDTMKRASDSSPNKLNSV